MECFVTLFPFAGFYYLEFSVNFHISTFCRCPVGNLIDSLLHFCSRDYRGRWSESKRQDKLITLSY
jgi:hypothetical protein